MDNGSVPLTAYMAASCVKPRSRSPSCAANPMTSSRHSARPIAIRSDNTRGFWIFIAGAWTSGLSTVVHACMVARISTGPTRSTGSVPSTDEDREGMA